MRIATRYLVGIAASLLWWLPGIPVEAEEDSRPALVAVPSFQGELPDGTPVTAIVVVPAENVLNKNAAWRAWEAQWPTTYRLSAPTESTESSIPE